MWVRALESRDGSVDAESMAQRVRDSYASPIVRFAVATAPRRGFALVEAGRADPSEALLHYLAVDPDGVGAGVGRALLADAIHHTRSLGFRSLVLEVRPDNTRAVGIYVRAGFVPFGEPIPHPIAGYSMQSYRLSLAHLPD